MTLEDMLEMLRRDWLRDTSDAVAGDDPALWSDATLIRYIDQAQIEFAKRTVILRDKITFTTAPYQREYPLTPNIFAVISAKSLGNGSYVNGIYQLNEGVPIGTGILYPERSDLARAGHALFEGHRDLSYRPFDVNALSHVHGRPIGYDTDEVLKDNNGQGGGMVVRMYPTPSPAYAYSVIECRVGRMPNVRLSEQDVTVTPEIPYEYLLNLLDYAAFLALRIVDHEASDPERAKDFEASFEAATERARREVQRKMFTPQGWGFGLNGFGYTGN